MSTIRVAAVGDIMCGESFYQYRNGPRTHIDVLGERYLDSSLVDFLKGHDLVVGNVECPLSDVGYRPNSLRRHHMRGRPEAAALLAKWGFNAVTVANNHILEHGLAAAIDTVSHLEAAGITVVGTGSDSRFSPGASVAAIDVKGLTVKLIGACVLEEKYAFNGGVPPDKLVSLVAEHASTADCLIVLVHWGVEYIASPSELQHQLGRQLIHRGATLVVGSHPHVVQGVDPVERGLVAYSLGNFIFDQPLPEARRGAVLACRLSAGRVCGFQTTPVDLGPSHAPTLPAHCTPCIPAVDGTPRSEQGQHAPAASTSASAASDRQRAFRRAMRRQLWQTMRRSTPGFALQALSRPIARRLNWW